MTTLDPEYGLALVTDGSANWKDRTGGWAWIALDAWDGIVKDSGYKSNVTSNQMELYAPTEGLGHLYSEHGPSEVLVYSDSEYLVLGATHPTRARNKNKKYWKALDREIEQHTYVEFIHVKGHNGHLWNEMADEMANKARLGGRA